MTHSPGTRSRAMQPLHILCKDAMHLWPEIIVSILVLSGFGWLETVTWQPNLSNAGLISFGAGVLRFLVPVSWLILTSRLVHDEELVGDRQFWITRPYTWYFLLLSKLLSLVVFLCIPFLFMQMVLLHHAGLYPTLSLPALLHNLVQVVGFSLLVLIAIAACTATFVRYASSVIVGILYSLLLFGVVVWNWPDNFAAPYMQYPLNMVILALVVAALVIQYARRKTMIARLLLIAVPIAVVLVLALAPVNALVNHRYPERNLGSLQFDSSTDYQQTAGRIVNRGHSMFLNLPVRPQLTGLPDKGYAAATVIRATGDGPNGYHFDTGWGPTQGMLVPGEGLAGVFLRIPEKDFNRIHDQAIALHILLGVRTFAPGTPYTVTATEKPFPLPGHAACTVSVDDGQLECRFPLKAENTTRVEALVTNGTCLAPGVRSTIATGFIPPQNAVFDPVAITKVQLSVGKQNVSLCPGTSTTFIAEAPADFARLHFDIPSITIDTYAMRIPVAAAAK